MQQLLTLLLNGIKSLFDLEGIPLSKRDLAMKKDRDDWMLLNMLVPSIFVLLNFWTNPLPFFAKHVYFFILPSLLLYGVLVTLYENKFKVHTQPTYSLIYCIDSEQIFGWRKKDAGVVACDIEHQVFISLYPPALLLMTIPAFRMLQNLTIWKLNNVLKFPFNKILSVLENLEEGDNVIDNEERPDLNERADSNTAIKINLEL